MGVTDFRLRHKVPNGQLKLGRFSYVNTTSFILIQKQVIEN